MFRRHGLSIELRRFLLVPSVWSSPVAARPKQYNHVGGDAVFRDARFEMGKGDSNSAGSTRCQGFAYFLDRSTGSMASARALVRHSSAFRNHETEHGVEVIYGRACGAESLRHVLFRVPTEARHAA